MSMHDRKKPVLRLVPARPPGEEDAWRYLPQVRWRYLASAAGVLLVVVLGYLWKEQRKAAELRTHIARLHGKDLAAARSTYQSFRDELERLTIAAANAPTDTSIASDFQLQDLASGRGSYLRIPLASATSSAAIDEAAKSMQPDWIPGCLGLVPTTSREIFEIGQFLLPSFVAGLDKQSVMQLRVRDDTLRRRVRTDLPNLLATTHSDWFMLALEEGKNRRDEPVRIFVWDLKRNTLLLRARVRSQGVVVNSRILSQGTETGAPAKSADNNTEASNDCSIAAALKQLATQ